MKSFAAVALGLAALTAINCHAEFILVGYHFDMTSGYRYKIDFDLIDRCYDVCHNEQRAGYGWDDLPDNVQYRFFMDVKCEGEYMTGAKVTSGTVDLWGTPFFEQVSSFILMSTKKGTIKNGYASTCPDYEATEWWNAMMANETRA